jgi:flagellar motor protein MotB
LKNQPKTSEEQGPKVPGYIVTYSDMVTLLLTFFVMLLTLAEVQDPELFDKGRDSFLESLRYVGLGTLFGRQKMPQLGHIKNISYIANPEQTFNNRTLDARAEELNRILKELMQLTTTINSRITAEKINFSVVNVHFSPGMADLDNRAMKFLKEFCRDLQLASDRKPGMLYVLGLAPDEKTEKEQWLLSARRSEAVAQFLRNNLESTANLQTNQSFTRSMPKWSVHSWGAGPGGYWTGPDSSMSKHSQILIAILK